MSFVPAFFENYFLLVYTFACTYILGFVIALCTKENTGWLQELKILVSGSLTLIISYAIFRTNFHSLFALGLIILLVCFYIYAKKPLFSLHKIQFKFLPITLLALTLCYVFCYFQFYNPITKISYSCANDYATYIRYASHLNQDGVENILLDKYLESSKNPTPYHYGDLWHMAVLSKITFTTSATSFFLGYAPLCLTLIYISALALFSIKKTKLRWHDYLWASILIFICTHSFYFPETSYTKKMFFLDEGIVLYTKSFLLQVLLSISILCLYHKNYLLFNAVALFMMVFYFVLMPVLLGAVLIFNIYLYFRKHISRKQLVLFSSCNIGIGVLCLLFYAFNAGFANDARSDGFLNNPAIYNISDYLVNLKGIFVLIEITIIKLLPYLVLPLLFLPFRTILSKLRLIPNNLILIWLIVIYISGAICYELTYHIIDSHQLFTLSSIIVLQVFLFLLVDELLLQSMTLKKTTTFILLYGLCLVQNQYSKRKSEVLVPVDTAFVNKLNLLLEGQVLGANVAFFEKQDSTKSFYFYNSSLNIPISYLIQYYPNYNPVCLSYYEVPGWGNSNSDKLNNHNSFYRYVQNLRAENTFIGIEEAQQQFLSRNHIEFVLFKDKKELPVGLAKSLTHLVESTDKQWTFAKLTP